VGRAISGAREAGYKQAYAECMGPGSLRPCQKNGFQIKHSIKYTDYEYGGRKPFEAVPKQPNGPEGMDFVVCDLRNSSKVKI
jgi:hypothetical protein